MLVLARREGEKLSIADGEIKVTVLSVTGKIVRLGFEAPNGIRIERFEVAEKEDKKHQNK